MTSAPLPLTMKSLLQLDLSSKTIILTTQPLPIPAPNSTEHLIRVHAAALTSGELLWMKDISPTSKLNSLVPCFDMSGTVITAPPDSPFQPGTAVYACTNFYRPGAGREYTICETSELACKPETLSFVEASTVPMSAETAWQALFVHAGLLPVKGTGARGKRVFVTGASGAAGMWVVQLAKWAGAEVVGTAGRERLDFVKSLGASEVLDYRNTDVKEWVEGDEGRKSDVVIHTFGSQALTDAWWAVRDGGTLISFFQPPEGAKPKGLARRDVKALFFIVKTLGEYAARVAELVDGGGFVTCVDGVWPLEKFENAVERMESGKARGKVVIEFVPET